MSWLFTSGGQSVGASTTILPRNIQGLFPLGLSGFLLAVQGILKSLLQHNSKASEGACCINLLSFDDFDENEIHPNHLNKKEN